MSNKHKKTLEKIFEIPTRNDISYREVKSLLEYFGGIIKNGKGSRRKLSIKTEKIAKPLVRSFHEPHGSNSFGEDQIERFRLFFTILEITPDKDHLF